MKRKIPLLLLAAGSIFKMNSQVVFSESFVTPFNPVSAGWDIQNLSSPIGTINPSWFQGVTSQFNAFSGAPTDYYASNFGATAATGTNNTISSWFITPTLNLVNGNVVEFYTRTSTTPTVFPDRLQLYYSTAGSGTNVGTTAGTATNTAGTFTNIMLDINPTLNLTAYPTTWTLFSATITGVPVSVVGRLAFRYYVTQGGNSGQNSNYIGIDNFAYKLPCAQPTLAVAQTTTGVCSGGTVSLLATTFGSIAAVSYTWSTGQNGSAIVVTPTATTVYTVSGTSSTGCVGTATAAISVTATPVLNAPSFTVCSNPAVTVTLTASGATSYSWNTGATTATNVQTPTTTTSYTVTGFGSGGNCPGIGTTTITVGNSLSMPIVASATSLCSGRTLTLTTSTAASTLAWGTNPATSLLSSSSSFTVIPTATTTYTLGGASGTFPNLCLGNNSILITVLPSPTLGVSISPSPTTICSDADFTVTATGAVTYTYFLGGSNNFTNNPIGLFAPVVTSLTTTGFTLAGTGTNGCISAGIVTLNVNPNPTVTAASSAPTVCVNKTVTLTGSGADTYAWSGATTSTANPVVYTAGSTAGAQQFTLIGKSLVGCSDTTALSVNVVTCNVVPSGISNIDGSYSELSVFPNPFSNELKLSGVTGNVEVYNALGQIVLKTTVNGSETVITSDLPKGAYILKVYSPQGDVESTLKLLKN